MTRYLVQIQQHRCYTTTVQVIAANEAEARKKAEELGDSLPGTAWDELVGICTADWCKPWAPLPFNSRPDQPADERY